MRDAPEPRREGRNCGLFEPDIDSRTARSGMILTMKALESGRVLLSAAERRQYTRAEAYLRRRCGMDIATAEPVLCDEVLFLELTRLALAGDFERVDRIIEEIAKFIVTRVRTQ
jgi:hypothetical protein